MYLKLWAETTKMVPVVKLLNAASYKNKATVVLHARRLHDRLVQLAHRSLVEVTGKDAGRFLQGLTTADVLVPTSLAQYSLFLNHQGRVLYDTIIYHTGRESMLIECDRRASESFVKHLTRYRLRTKVELAVNDEATVCLLPTNASDKDIRGHTLCVPDPRTSVLGSRVLFKKGGASLTGEDGGLDQYHEHRIASGVAEGSEEIPYTDELCLPFELNMDYLNGVSFTKGCYLGQELTSRTHHTGVVRKRLIPMTLENLPPSSIPWGTKIVSSSGKRIGKAIGHRGKHMIGILRLPDLEEGQSLGIQIPSDNGQEDIFNCQWHKPSWWPCN